MQFRCEISIGKWQILKMKTSKSCAVTADCETTAKIHHGKFVESAPSAECAPRCFWNFYTRFPDNSCYFDDTNDGWFYLHMNGSFFLGERCSVDPSSGFNHLLDVKKMDVAKQNGIWIHLTLDFETRNESWLWWKSYQIDGAEKRLLWTVYF